MLDYQEISEQIRAYLAAQGQTLADGVSDLAINYANLCREANSRLRLCSEYLRRGMRSEAIHLADCQPNLFQLVESLNFPEQPAWARICATHGLPIPSPLFVECVEDLKAAYGHEQELLPLLSRHRVLALAHATVSTRLEVLRLLVDADPDNTCWISEIRMLETARFQEMRVEANGAVHNQDIAILKRLGTELSDRPWLCDVPEDLTEIVDKATKDQNQDFTELRELTTKLHAAYRDRNFNAQTLADLRRWQELLDDAGPDLPPELRRDDPAFTWLAAEGRRAETPPELKPRILPSPAPVDAPPRRSIARILFALLGLFLGAGGVGWFIYYHATHLK